MTPPERPERPDRPAGPGPSRPARGHATLDRPSGTVVTPDALQVRSRPVLPAGDGGGGVGGPLGPLGRRVETAIRAVLARDWAVLGLLLVLAALLRFPGLESRGRFDGDQGHDVSCSSASSGTARCRSSVHRRRSATSTTAPPITTCSPRWPG